MSLSPHFLWLNIFSPPCSTSSSLFLLSVLLYALTILSLPTVSYLLSLFFLILSSDYFLFSPSLSPLFLICALSLSHSFSAISPCSFFLRFTGWPSPLSALIGLHHRESSPLPLQRKQTTIPTIPPFSCCCLGGWCSFQRSSKTQEL